MHRVNLYLSSDLLIEQLSDPQFLLVCSRLFHEYEGRDVGYIVPRYIMMRSEESVSKVIDIENFVISAKLIMYTWNAAWYLRLPKDKKRKLEKDLEFSYKKIHSIYVKFNNKSLLDVDLDDKKVFEDISKLYEEFRGVSGVTGASKILHILNPRLFPLWDTRIKEFYHRIHSGRSRARRHKIGSAKCYIEFMKQIKYIISKILDVMSERELWTRHLNSLPPEVKRAYRTFRMAESPVKIIDECNYILITLGKQINSI